MIIFASFVHVWSSPLFRRLDARPTSNFALELQSPFVSAVALSLPYSVPRLRGNGGGNRCCPAMSHHPDIMEPKDYVNYGGSHCKTVPVDLLCCYPLLASSLDGLYNGDSVYLV